MGGAGRQAPRPAARARYCLSSLAPRAASRTPAQPRRSPAGDPGSKTLSRRSIVRGGRPSSGARRRARARRRPRCRSTTSRARRASPAALSLTPPTRPRPSVRSRSGRRSAARWRAAARRRAAGRRRADHTAAEAELAGGGATARRAPQRARAGAAMGVASGRARGGVRRIRLVAFLAGRRRRRRRRQAKRRRRHVAAGEHEVSRPATRRPGATLERNRSSRRQRR